MDVSANKGAASSGNSLFQRRESDHVPPRTLVERMSASLEIWLYLRGGRVLLRVPSITVTG
jgi:hypothetical protein